MRLAIAVNVYSYCIEGYKLNLATFTNFQDCESMSGAVWLHVHVSGIGWAGLSCHV